MVAELALLRGEQSMHQERVSYHPSSRTHTTLCCVQSVSGNPALECELRKERAVSRRYQVATEHLLQFVEVPTHIPPTPHTHLTLPPPHMLTELS